MSTIGAICFRRALQDAVIEMEMKRVRTTVLT
jgi:hypothetical protein